MNGDQVGERGKEGRSQNQVLLRFARGPLNLGPVSPTVKGTPKRAQTLEKDSLPHLCTPWSQNLTQFRGPDHLVGSLLSGPSRDKGKTKMSHQKA